jgi:hypothetical protein
MKTIKIIAFVVFGFMTVQHVNALTDSILISPLPKHEIGVSYGFMPLVYLIAPVIFNKFTLTRINFNYSYMYNFNTKHSIGTTISFLFSTYVPPDDHMKTMSISQQFQYKYTYKRKKNISMYFAIGAGFIIEDTEVDKVEYNILSGFLSGRMYWLSYQVDFFGISFGKERHNGFVELGWGNQGSLKIGYKYKF